MDKSINNNFINDDNKQRRPSNTILKRHVSNNNNNDNVKQEKQSLLLSNSYKEIPLRKNSLTTTVLFENEFNRNNKKNEPASNTKNKSFSILSSNKKSQSDIDSKINTIDNQSDISRCKNDVNADDENDNNDENDEDKLLFPGFVKKTFYIFTQQSKPRYWCLKMITSPWFERISMLVILINCLTLGMYQPCEDNPCVSTRCIILQYCDHFIYAFFSIEMMIKIMAMGFIGKDTYLAETWNRLDLFIVIAG